MSKLTVEQARECYQQLAPSDALLARVQARLDSGSVQPPSNGSGPPPIHPGASGTVSALGPKLIAWTLAASTLATFVWVASRPKPPASSPAPAASALDHSSAAPRVPPRGHPMMTEPLPSGAKSLAPHERTSSADEEFFEVESTATAKGKTLLNRCLATWNERAVFPGSGQSASQAADYLYGTYTCHLQSINAPDDDWVFTLSIARAAEPIVGCESGRGLRVPLTAEGQLLNSDTTWNATGLVLVQDRTHFSLSLRTTGKENLVFVLTRGPWSDLSEHQILQGTASLGPPGQRHTGPMRCHQVR